MSKRTKKTFGTRRKKNRVNYRKKTLKNKKFRKSRRGYRGGEGSDDEDDNKDNEANSNSKRLINGIKSLTLRQEEEDNCPICFEPLNKFTVTTDCNHKFHIDCLKPVCKQDNPRCPLCRKDISHTCQMLNYDSSQIIFCLSYYYKNKLNGNVAVIKDMLNNPLFDPSLPDSKQFVYPIINELTDVSIGVSSLLYYIIMCDNDELTDAYLNLKHPQLTDLDLLDVKYHIIEESIELHSQNYLENYIKTIQKMKLVPQKFPNILNIENPLLAITENFTSDKSAVLVTFMNRVLQFNVNIPKPDNNLSLYDKDICMNEGKDYKEATLSILSNPNLELSVINNTPSIYPLVPESFGQIVLIGDNDLTNLYLNFMNPYLTNNNIIELKQFIFTEYDGSNLMHFKKNFKYIIKKMKKPPIRQNFPNITSFPS